MVLVTVGSKFSDDLRRCAANDPTLCALDWAENSLDASDAALLAKSLDGNTHLQTLTVRYGIYMTNAATEQLELALVHTNVVRAVVVGRSYSHNGRAVVRDGRHAAHSAAVRRHCVANAARRAATGDPSLVEIDWSNTDADDDDLAQLALSLSHNNQVQRILLSNCRGVTDRGASLLAVALVSSSVVRVDIDSCHRVSKEGAAALRHVWVKNTVRRVKAQDVGLQEVDWSNTEADNDDLLMLATALPGSTRVTAIQLAHNRLIGDIGVAVLHTALQHSGVVVVAMDVTSVSERLKVAIRRICVANATKRLARNDPTLTELDWRVMRHPVLNDDFFELSRSLRGNTCLRMIRLGGNRALNLEPGPWSQGDSQMFLDRVLQAVVSHSKSISDHTNNAYIINIYNNANVNYVNEVWLGSHQVS
jgi:hypothetical protein